MPECKLARNLDIYRDRRLGMKYRVLSEKYGLAVQRVWMIVQSMQEREKADARGKGTKAPSG